MSENEQKPQEDDVQAAMDEMATASNEPKPYVVFADGGRQYRVAEGETLDVDYRDGLEEGAELNFDRVLAVSDGKELRFETPVLEGLSLSATVVKQTQVEKLYIQKFRRRKNSRRRTGHRQKYTRIQIGKVPC